MLNFAKDKNLWKKIRESDDYSRHRAEILSLYNKAFKDPPRPHSVNEILKGGNDDGLWHIQLTQLESSAIMALIYPDNDEYFQSLLEIIWAYCNDYTWAPLGHYNSYYNTTPYDYDPGLIDIFASSIAFSLAEIKNLFNERLPQLIKDRISAELKRRTFDPFLTRTFFWEKHPNNWAAVCAGGVGSAMMYECPEVFLEQRERLDSVMQVYLDSYADDGVCVEGAGYWGFGFGFFSSYAMLEKELTNGSVDWFKNEKVKEIATFMQKMFLQKDVIVSFSDCSGIEQYILGLPHMLRGIYGDTVEKLPFNTARIAENNTHFNFLLRSFIYFNPEFIADDIKTNVTYNMKDSAYFVKRTENYGFACKGGNNGESHNHNDVGNFILARNNQQIICDLGAGPYEDGYHTEKRYTFFNPSAYSHNIPFFDGVGQDGVMRENVYLDYNEKESSVSMNFTNGYGIDYLKKAERKFVFHSDFIEMTDKFELTRSSEITERFVSRIEPKILDGVVVIDDIALICESGITPEISVKELKYHANPGTYSAYLIDYIINDGSTEFKIRFETPKK
ncbi:MAG: heparinase II/III family protein [Clostridia bacterium]|nr:heparinase II/III family protein [Clostridia bacterium]